MISTWFMDINLLSQLVEYDLYNLDLYLSTKMQLEIDKKHPYRQVGKNIREIREIKLGISSQEEFGKAIKTRIQPDGYLPQSVSLWETGRNLPETEALIYIANWGDTTIDWILGRVESKDSDLKTACENCYNKAQSAPMPLRRTLFGCMKQFLRLLELKPNLKSQ